MKHIMIVLVLTLCILCSACGTAPEETAGPETSLSASSEASTEAVTEPSASQTDASSEETAGAEVTTEETTEETTDAATADTANAAFFEQTKDYILNGQTDVPDGELLNWSPAFLDAVDFEAVYKTYLSGGGRPEDISAFAAYLTEHAVAPENWQVLFEADLKDAYPQTVDHYENLGDDIYQVYAEIDGKVVPYVVVDSRTGWFHG